MNNNIVNILIITLLSCGLKINLCYSQDVSIHSPVQIDSIHQDEKNNTDFLLKYSKKHLSPDGYKKLLNQLGIKEGNSLDSLTRDTIKTISFFEEKSPDSCFSFTETKQFAQIAWQYFKCNYNEKTGYVNAVEGYELITLWDLGSNLAGYVAADKLNIVAHEEIVHKLKIFLSTCNKLKFYNDEMPNNVYNSKTGDLINNQLNVVNIGQGWAAVDVGRFLIWLKIVKQFYSEFDTTIDALITKFNFNRAVQDSCICGLHRNKNGKEKNHFNEGYLGYREYAAHGFAFWGLMVDKSIDYKKNVLFKKIQQDILPIDKYGMNYLTSEPFILSGLEFGWQDEITQKIVSLVYNIQKNRWNKTDKITMVSEDAVDKYPWFVYYCIYALNQKWICLNMRGKLYDHLKTASLKATFAWHVLLRTHYTKLAFDYMKDCYNPKKGWYAGKYENGKINKSLNINTNAIVLEALLFHKLGTHFAEVKPR